MIQYHSSAYTKTTIQRYTKDVRGKMTKDDENPIIKKL